MSFNSNLIKFLHDLPHLGFGFNTYDGATSGANFHPDDEGYWETLAMLAAICFGVVLVLMISLLLGCCISQCCCRTKSLYQSRATYAVLMTIFFFFLTIGAFGANIYSSVKFTSNTNDIVDQVQSLNTTYMSAIKGITVSLSDCTSAEHESTQLHQELQSAGAPANLQQAVQEMTQQITQAASSLQDVVDGAPTFSAGSAYTWIDKVDLWRRITEYCLTSLFFLTCVFAIVFAIKRKATPLLIIFALHFFLFLILGVLGAGFAGAAMGMGDVCYDLDGFVQANIDDDSTLQYYVNCKDPQGDFVWKSDFQQWEKGVDQANQTLQEVGLWIKSSNKTFPSYSTLTQQVKLLNQSRVKVESELLCTPYHKAYVDVSTDVCNGMIIAVSGLSFSKLGAFILMFFATIFTLHVARFRNVVDYYEDVVVARKDGDDEMLIPPRYDGHVQDQPRWARPKQRGFTGTSGFGDY